MNLAFDPVTERTRFEARQTFLARQAALRLELAQGITFQPETAESVEDQVVETLWAEPGGQSLVATLFLGFPDAVRDAKLAALHLFPDQLRLVFSDGFFAVPTVDRGAAGPEDRLPAVLALRYFIPDGCTITALVSNHAEVSGRWAAPAAWGSWPS